MRGIIVSRWLSWPGRLAVALAAWALVEDAYKLEREAADDLGDLAAVWAKWTREREFSNGDFIQFGGVLQP